MVQIGILLREEKDRRVRRNSFFFSFLLIFIGNISYSQQSIQFDSSKFIERSIDGEALQKLREDKDFQYHSYSEPPTSIWDRFWSWIWWKIDQVMRTKPGRITLWTVIILLSVAAIVFFIMHVAGMNKAGLFSRKGDETLPYNLSSDDINQISFEEAIEKAILEKNFRLALRLLYLQSLKKLSDKEYIEWQINKTNNDYIHEVANKPWHSVFKSLTWQFEYAWYGEVNIGKEDLDSLRVQFKQFNNQL